jgi:DNA-binding NarL/FixJ family response regulator
MDQLPKQTNERIGKEPSTSPLSNVVLLNRKQWAYVQKKYDLTCRERQIAELICQGMRNGSIARALRIRPGTAKTHTRNIYRKIQVKSRIAMLLRFVAASRELSIPYEGTRSIPITD